MRSLSVTQIKRKLKGNKKIQALQEQPHAGTRVREIYDLLFANIGKPVHIVKEKSDEHRIMNLELFYGLDIRNIKRGFGNRFGTSAESSHILAGEWFGNVYVDYLADSEEQLALILEARDVIAKAPHAENLLPAGVYRLSKDSIEILKRVAAKGAAVTDKHSKRGA